MAKNIKLPEKLQATELLSLLQDLLQMHHIPSFQLQPQYYYPDPGYGNRFEN